LVEATTDFLNGAAECFEEKIYPTKRLEIEFICTTTGTHKSIEDALKATFGDMITCEHISC